MGASQSLRQSSSSAATRDRPNTMLRRPSRVRATTPDFLNPRALGGIQHDIDTIAEENVMAKFGRLFFCLVVCVLVLAASSSAQTRPAAIEKVAKTYGIDSFDKVEAIRYTFNLEIPALKLNLSHA